jgi:hypothetical protein
VPDAKFSSLYSISTTVSIFLSPAG